MVREGAFRIGYYNFLKKEGDFCKQDEIVVEMETHKALSQVRSPRSGKIIKIFTPPNDSEKFEIGNALFSLKLLESDGKKLKELMEMVNRIDIDSISIGKDHLTQEECKTLAAQLCLISKKLLK